MKPYIGINPAFDRLFVACLPRNDNPLPAEESPVQTTTHRPGWHTFRWLQDSRPGMDAEHLMRRYGIPVTARHIPGRSVPGVEVGFAVPRHQAVWAEYLLCRAGWRVVTPLLDARHAALFEHAQANGATRPVGGGRIRRQGITAKFFGVMDELIGLGAAHRERTQPPQTRWRTLPPPQPVHRTPTLYTRLKNLIFGQ
jgi:hypothetical protein